MCTDLLYVVCIGLLSDEFQRWIHGWVGLFLESSRFKSLFTDKQFLSHKFLETRIMEIKAIVLTEDAMTMEVRDY